MQLQRESLHNTAAKHFIVRDVPNKELRRNESMEKQVVYTGGTGRLVTGGLAFELLTESHTASVLAGKEKV